MSGIKMSEHYEETYYMVPTYIRKMPGMTLGYMDVYNIIFQFWNKGKQCYVKNEIFIERTGFTERYIREALTYFEGLGELKRVMKGKRRYLVKPEKIIEVEIDNEQPVDKKPMGELQFRDGGTTVPGMGELQFRKDKGHAPSEPTPRKGSSKRDSLLNKEDLNKEINNNSNSVVVDRVRARIPGLMVGNKTIETWIADKGESYVMAKIEMLFSRHRVNPTGWLIDAIKNNYINETSPSLSPPSLETWSESLQDKRKSEVEKLRDPNDWRDLAMQEQLSKQK